MVAENPSSELAGRLADRLAAARRGRFVGRMAELGLFRAALLESEPSLAILHVHGPGGVGKTTLLREFARIAGEVGRPVIQLDSRHLEPSPTGFLQGLSQAIGLVAEPPPPTMPDIPQDCVLLIDTYEVVDALDTWLREVFLPQMPARSLTVIAGRNAPAPTWRADTGWAGLTRIVALDNLSAEESQTYLTARGIPSAHHTSALSFTGGHPLALALVTDTLQRGGEIAAFDPGSEPDLLRALLERLVKEIPSAGHRRALDACVIARTTTEDLLAGISGIDDPHACFEWLRWQSFIEHGPRGVFPHDLAREVLLADLRWRNPREWERLIGWIWRHLWRRIARTDGEERRRLQMDALYVIRTWPTVTPYFDWTATDRVFADPATEEDAGAIIDMVRRHEGRASAEIAGHWLRRQSQAFLVFRGRELDLFGFSTLLALERVTPEDVEIDPAVRASLRFIDRYGPLASGEEAIFLRYWMHRERYQETTAATNLMAVNVITQCITNHRLAWNFISMSDPDFWTPHFDSVNFPRAPAADFDVGGRRFGVFAHDWRVEPAADWMTPRGKPMPFANSSSEPEPALSESEFANAVRQALRDYTREDLLATNPLLRSRLVREASAEGGAVTALRTLLRKAVTTLDEHPRDVKFHRAIWHTYIEPAPTQERVAELLDLPFNTYRYQLARGIERVTSYLWRLEQGHLSR